MITSADLLFLASLLGVAGVIVFASTRLSPRAMGRLLLLLVGLCVALMASFQLLDISVCGATPAHSALLTFAQSAVYYLAFKLWLSLCYPGLGPRARGILHVCAHSMFAFTVCANYWLRTWHPVLLVALYPGFSLSQTLFVQAVERRLAQAPRPECPPGLS